MKKIVLITVCLAFALVSCKGNKEVDPKAKVTVGQSSIQKGKKLFNSQTCNSCHQEKVKIIGPSIKEIAEIYEAKKGNLVHFLMGTSEAIVDTNPGQVAVMQASLAITKSMSKSDLESISEYILSIK